MAFEFDAAAQERLFEAIGRRDSGAWHLVEDIEAALGAYVEAAGRVRAQPELAERLESGLAETLLLATRLRTELYELPARATHLQAIGEIDHEHAARLTGSAEQAARAIEPLLLSLRDARDTSAARQPGPGDADAILLRSIAQAFRNRLNIKPTAAAEGLFMRVMKALLGVSRERAPRFAAYCAGISHEALDELLQGTH